ncbi:small ribosomal subunit protein eS27-like [Gorilla gorilla gorilla]|uniref:small ribosomal subunit protein eS27-like n=1 Tax=Gorilla gorilla gorilla TaxID=9595 RepID=UPI00244619DF|nr:40S ribosomal protein S27-like [Gorilla gorilla gorilla]
MPLTEVFIPLQKRRPKQQHPGQSLRSYFMDVKYPGCYKITMVFSHKRVLAVPPSSLCQRTGGKARPTEGRSCRRKQHRKHSKGRRMRYHPHTHILGNTKHALHISKWP